MGAPCKGGFQPDLPLLVQDTRSEKAINKQQNSIMNAKPGQWFHWGKKLEGEH